MLKSYKPLRFIPNLVASTRKSPINCNFNHEDPRYDKIELEITFKCNATCKNCNRMCGMMDLGDSNMTIGQIEHFIHEMTNKKHEITSIAIIGGEALTHPDFLEIWFLLYNKLYKTGIIRLMMLATNCILPVPKELQRCTYQLVPSPPHTKQHFNFYTSPTDVEVEVQRCDVVKRCGIALNTFGYFPCAGGGSALSMLLNLNMAKYSLPPNLSVWDYNDICKYCCFAYKNRVYEDMNSKEIKCSKTFFNAMEHFFAKPQRNPPRYPEINIIKV